MYFLIFGIRFGDYAKIIMILKLYNQMRKIILSFEYLDYSRRMISGQSYERNSINQLLFDIY